MWVVTLYSRCTLTFNEDHYTRVLPSLRSASQLSRHVAEWRGTAVSPLDVGDAGDRYKSVALWAVARSTTYQCTSRAWDSHSLTPYCVLPCCCSSTTASADAAAIATPRVKHSTHPSIQHKPRPITGRDQIRSDNRHKYRTPGIIFTF